MDIEKIVTLSNKHLSLSTRKQLKSEGYRFPFIEVYAKAGSGWFLCIDEKCFYDSIRYNKYPGDIKTIVSYALHMGCKMICIDEAAEPVLHLPIYDYRFNVPIAGGNPGDTCTVEDIWCGGVKLSHNRVDL